MSFKSLASVSIQLKEYGNFDVFSSTRNNRSLALTLQDLFQAKLRPLQRSMSYERNFKVFPDEQLVNILLSDSENFTFRQNSFIFVVIFSLFTRTVYGCNKRVKIALTGKYFWKYFIIYFGIYALSGAWLPD